MGLYSGGLIIGRIFASAGDLGGLFLGGLIIGVLRIPLLIAYSNYPKLNFCHIKPTDGRNKDCCCFCR